MLVFVWQLRTWMTPGVLLVAEQAHGRAGPGLCVCTAVGISDGTRHAVRG